MKSVYILSLFCLHNLSAKHLTAHRSNQIDIIYRLPTNTKPEAYDISLWTSVHIGNQTFGGEANILLEAAEDTTNITLHYRDLNILETKVFTFELLPLEIPIKNTNYNAKTEFYEIFVENPLAKGKRYTLLIKYQGQIKTTTTQGVFGQSYLNSEDDLKWLLFTNFPLQNARHGFPCYDEPAFKATFRLSITHGLDYTAISNMPGSRMVPFNANGTVTTIFEPTPLMPTYSIAFAVTDYASLGQLPTNNRILNQVFAPPEKFHQSELILDIGAKVLDVLTNYTGVSLSIRKMDHIVIPIYAGTMENSGLSGYGDSWFHYDDSVDTFIQKESIYTTMGHSTAHQWFGIMVSPSWWTYIWLSEGFANYFSYKSIDLVYPDMKMMEAYVIDNVHLSLQIDGTTYAHPMTNLLVYPNENSFDIDKMAAGSVINMFSHAFSERSFQKGLKYYLDQRRYADATEEDLFNAFEKAVKEDNTLSPRYHVNSIMASWTRQASFPILHVSVQDDGTIKVVQKRYFNDEIQLDEKSLWWIPYNYVTESDTGSVLTSTFPDGWIHRKITIIERENLRKRHSNDWVVFNKQQTGYYRVMYDEQNYKRIADGLARDSSKLHPLTKGQLLDDAINFVNSDQIQGHGLLLDLLRFLKQETEYIPWKVGYTIISLLDIKLIGTKHYDLFEEFIRNLITKLFDSVGIYDLENESHLQKRNRDLAINLACSKNLVKCLSITNTRLKMFIDKGIQFHQNLRNTLLCASLRNANETEFFHIWQLMLNADDQNYRNSLSAALSCTQSKELLQQLVHSTLKSTNVNEIDYRTGEPFQILFNTYQNGYVGLQMVIEFVSENAVEVQQTFFRHYLNNLTSGIATRITTSKLVAAFYEMVDNLGDSINPDDSYEILKDNQKWNEKYLNEINQWLITNVSPKIS